MIEALESRRLLSAVVSIVAAEVPQEAALTAGARRAPVTVAALAGDWDGTYVNTRTRWRPFTREPLAAAIRAPADPTEQRGTFTVTLWIDGVEAVGEGRLKGRAVRVTATTVRASHLGEAGSKLVARGKVYPATRVIEGKFRLIPPGGPKSAGPFLLRLGL